MLKSAASFLLVILSLQNSVIIVGADEPIEKAVKRIAKAKTEVAKIGAGAEAGVKVKLLSGVEWKGRVVESKENEFTINDLRTGQTIAIPYQNVARIKKWNMIGGMSKVKKRVIITSVVAGVALTILGIVKVRNRGLNLPRCFPLCSPKP